jgi:hypothetical protein
MPIAPASLKRWAPSLAMVAVILVALVGGVAFLLAMRPCVLELPPGRMATYRLVHEFRAWPEPEPIETIINGETHREPAPDPVLRRDERTLWLIGTGADGDAALLVSGAAEAQRPELVRVHLANDGTVRRRHPQEGLLDEGPTIDFFDFNLLPLPEGLEQRWDTSLPYAYPPAGQRVQRVSVRRTHNGSTPRFHLKMPTIEWVDRRPGTELEERYVQIKDLSARYRFDTGRGLVERADLTFITGAETIDGLQRYRVRISLELLDVSTAPDAVGSLHQAAEAIAELQAAIDRQDPVTSAALARQLAGLPVQTPALAAAAGGLARDAAGVPPAQAGWAVRVAAVDASRDSQAEQLRLGLVADGYPAYISRQGALLLVSAGPFRERKDAVLQDLTRRYPSNRPYWVEVQP